MPAPAPAPSAGSHIALIEDNGPRLTTSDNAAPHDTSPFLSGNQAALLRCQPEPRSRRSSQGPHPRLGPNSAFSGSGGNAPSIMLINMPASLSPKPLGVQ